MAAHLRCKVMNHFCMILLCYGSLVFLMIKAKNVQVKIVEEPAVYGGVNAYYQQSQTSHSKELEPRTEPIPLSGPPHLFVLYGECFSLIENSYKYELCPFHNITQREQTVRWNAFSGILGVYQGWVIVNNTFDSMLMGEGDLCPESSPRQTKVYFRCGNTHGLLSVREPKTCHYDMDFQTPLACPQDAFLVYPVLSPEGHATWESIEEDLWRDEITLQGYNKRRRKLFISEGFVAPDIKAQENRLWRREKNERRKNMEKGEVGKRKRSFLTIEHCSNAYDKLQAEVERLRKLVIPFNKDNSTQNVERKAGFMKTKNTTATITVNDDHDGVIRVENTTIK